jgi:hypothetical protein
MKKTQLPITCPVCGRKNDFPVEILFEGSTIVCPFCKLKLTLHGHMWEEIQTDLEALQKTDLSRIPENSS